MIQQKKKTKKNKKKKSFIMELFVSLDRKTGGVLYTFVCKQAGTWGQQRVSMQIAFQY